MADVYGRLTGKAGVALSTLGPGATNLLTGVADANLDRNFFEKDFADADFRRRQAGRTLSEAIRRIHLLDPGALARLGDKLGLWTALAQGPALLAPTCALSLAVPAVFAAASARLGAEGVLVAGGTVLTGASLTAVTSRLEVPPTAVSGRTEMFVAVHLGPETVLFSEDFQVFCTPGPPLSQANTRLASPAPRG